MKRLGRLRPSGQLVLRVGHAAAPLISFFVPLLSPYTAPGTVEGARKLHPPRCLVQAPVPGSQGPRLGPEFVATTSAAATGPHTGLNRELIATEGRAAGPPPCQVPPPSPPLPPPPLTPTQAFWQLPRRRLGDCQATYAVRGHLGDAPQQSGSVPGGSPPSRPALSSLPAQLLDGGGSQARAPRWRRRRRVSNTAQPVCQRCSRSTLCACSP